MDVAPRLIETTAPRDPQGVVLVLHGGASRRGSPMVSPTQLSVLRMVPIARRLARAGRGRLAVFRLLNSVRGWDSHHTPADDVAWALRRLVDRFPMRPPTALVGHSLGGRAALLAAQAPAVRSVVALNPWLHPTDAPALPGTAVLIVHGSADRIADPAVSATIARRLARATEVSYTSIRGGKHAMLRRHHAFDTTATDFTLRALLTPAATPHLTNPRWSEI